MARIWANRLWAGTKTWEQCPDTRKPAVLEIMREDVASGDPYYTAEKFEAITGETYEA